MKDPAVLFYTSDFLSGVTFLSMEQRGQYITLLCTQHQHGSIPENQLRLRDRIHENIAPLVEVMNNINEAIRIGILKAKSNN